MEDGIEQHMSMINSPPKNVAQSKISSQNLSTAGSRQPSVKEFGHVTSQIPSNSSVDNRLRLASKNTP